MATKKLTKAERRSKILQEAHDGGKPIINRLRELNAKCMEQTIEHSEYGYDWVTLVERWILPNGSQAVIVMTKDWRELFLQAAPMSCSWEATLNALNKAAEPLHS